MVAKIYNTNHSAQNYYLMKQQIKLLRLFSNTIQDHLTLYDNYLEVAYLVE